MTFSLAFLFLAPGVAPEGKAPDHYPRADLLAEAADLLSPESARKVRVLDVRSRDQYRAGHIPGAVWLNHEEWSRTFAKSQNPSDWEKRISALAITPDETIVIYDNAKDKEAARIWWILRYWGFDHARLLNGGWHAWHDVSGPISTENVTPAPTTPRLSARQHRLATKQQVLDSISKKTWQIVDARSKGEYCGKVEMAKRNGAMPGAVQLEWSDLLDPKTQRFKSAAELARIFRAAGIDLQQPTVTHCQSGGRASVMAFGLELMGAGEVRNYYRSWAEWGNADDTPIVIPREKK